MPTTAERMLALFDGCELGHGTYLKEERKPGRIKSEIKSSARTVRESVTAETWEKHLSGERALGIIPIRKNGSCSWGAIDVDNYDTLSHRDLAVQIADMGIPMLVCRSKSGGAHIFLFASEPVPCETMIEKLQEFASALGHADSEIFPKQTEINYERGDLGNWLNMPYHDIDHGSRYCVDREGRGLSVEKFLAAAERMRVTLDQLIDTVPKTPAEPEGELEGGPPCLLHLAAIGVAEGGRNKALFGFATLARKKFPDSWESKVEEWNQKYIRPPLSTEEVAGAIRSHKKKEYNYTCKEQPMASYCNATLCRTRQYGVGREGKEPAISSISILDTDEPLYFVSLEGGLGTVECDHATLLSPRLFQLAALKFTKTVVLPTYKQENWSNKIASLLATAVRIEAAKEVGVKGTFMEILGTWLTDRNRAKEPDEIAIGRPYANEDEQTYWFQLQDVMALLEQHKFRDYRRPQVAARLREIEGTSRQMLLRGKNRSIWIVPMDKFQAETEPYKTPKLTESPI